MEINRIVASALAVCLGGIAVSVCRAATPANAAPEKFDSLEWKLPVRAVLEPADTSWSEVFVQPGTDSTVYALLATGDTLVMGGAFERVGLLEAHSVALYDGLVWHALGAGLPGSVRALAWWRGSLIAGGTFTQAQGAVADYLAQWDGVAWVPVTSDFVDGAVYALASHGADLAVGGAFIQAGGVTLNCVGLYDGTAWRALGNGVSEDLPEVDALLSYRGSLFVGGHFVKAGADSVNHVANWDGFAWSGLASGVSSLGVLRSYVRSITVLNDRVLVAGYFLYAGQVETGSVATWNGSAWSGIGGSPPAEVYSTAAIGTRIFTAGRFDHVGYMVPASHAAVWTESAWKGLDSGLFTGNVYDIGKATCVALYRSQVIFGGQFTTADSFNAPNVAAWSGAHWAPFVTGQGLGFDVTSFVEHDDRLIVGGGFWSAGMVVSPGVAAWDGTAWSSLGAGFNNAVWSVAVFRGEVYAGGYFNRSGETAIAGVARWDGSAWRALGSGVNGPVRALWVWQDRLIAAGLFTQAGGQPAAYVAQWDGSAWTPLGTGLDAWAASLCTWNGSLVAGGAFRVAGGVPAAGVATWDGVGWAPCGTGIDATVGNPPVAWALEVYRGALLVGGDFDRAGGAPVQCLAAWDGATWQDVGGGVSGIFSGTFPRVQDLLVDGAFLTVCGIFTRAGSADANYIARWDGATWRALGSGVQMGDPGRGGVWGLGRYAGGLYAGGNIWTAGSVPSAYIARWDEADLVTAVRPPALRSGSTGHLRIDASPSVVPRGARVLLTYALGTTAVVRVAAYDVQGREVALVDAGSRTPGDHRVAWVVPATWAAGVYTLRVKAGVRRAMARIVVIR